MLNLKRLYIFTGKGGVGKTTCAFSFANYLQQNEVEVAYAYIANTSINNKEVSGPEISLPSVNKISLNLHSGVKDYVQMKLKSEIISTLVVKAPFFKSLVSMIPGFNYLIFLGDIIHRLNQNPKLHIILDSPSSGHALTMLRVIDNFAEIFKTGAIFDDILKMKKFLFNKEQTKINIISLPTELSQNEAIELEEEISTISENLSTQIIYNNIISNQFIKSDTIPDSLRQKIKNEQELLSSIDSINQIPKSYKLTKEELIEDISPFTQNLV